MRVADVMTSPALRVRHDLPAAAAWTLMRARRVHHLPVVDQEHDLVGMVSDCDLRQIAGAPGVDDATADLAPRLRGYTVEGLMRRTVVSVAPEEDVHDAVRLMRTVGMAALPVVEGDRVIGIVSERDLGLVTAADDAGDRPVRSGSAA